jgi:hypothetical protein
MRLNDSRRHVVETAGCLKYYYGMVVRYGILEISAWVDPSSSIDGSATTLVYEEPRFNMMLRMGANGGESKGQLMEALAKVTRQNPLPPR